MAQFETAFYLGQQTEAGYSGVEVEENFFVAFKAEDGLTPEAGREFLRYLTEVLHQAAISGLPDIENKLSSVIKEKNPPAGFSLSLGYLKGTILYLKTVGMGEIVIKRKNNVATLLSGDSSASGYFERDDVFVFTTSHFLDLVGGGEELKKIFDHKSPHQVVDDVASRFKAQGDQGAVAIFVHFTLSEESVAGGVEESETIIAPRSFIDQTRESLAVYYARFGRRKILTGITVLVIFLILLWSVVLSYYRRSNAEASEKINLARQFITQKLTEAEETAFFNMDSAIASITEGRQRLSEIKAAYPKRKEIEELEKQIAAAESKILKKEEAKEEEFFDLTVDNKAAKGDRLYLEGDTALILDKTNGNLYELSLDKKSLDKTTSPDLKKATLISSYEGSKYFYVPGQGVYTFDEEGKVKRVINQDKDWGVVKDLAAFNANLYVLDTGKDEVYKYAGTEDGFGAKASYFASGQATDLSFASNLIIDGSLYIGGGGSIIKFTSGLRDGFGMSLPEGNVGITRVFTSKDLDSVYAWDKKSGTVYVMDKEGGFDRQVKSEILTKATDLTVYNDAIYVLVNSKIFKVE